AWVETRMLVHCIGYFRGRYWLSFAEMVDVLCVSVLYCCSLTTPDSISMSLQRSCSSLTKSRNCSELPGVGSAPCSIIFLETSGSWIIRLTLSRRVATTSGGVPLGANSPNHEPARKPL